MWLLIEKYYDHLKEIEEHGSLIVPEEVLINTEEYRLKSDLYLQFISDNIKESPGDQLSIEEIYSVFQTCAEILDNLIIGKMVQTKRN